jgi:hypothetical protein
MSEADILVSGATGRTGGASMAANAEMKASWDSPEGAHWAEHADARPTRDATATLSTTADHRSVRSRHCAIHSDRRPASVSAVSKPGGSIIRPSPVAVAVALVTVVLVAVIDVASGGTAAAQPKRRVDTGFSQPYAGPPKYEYLAPTQIDNSDQLHLPIGQREADRIARRIGLNKAHAFTEEQYIEFITGKGVGGDPDQARLIDASVRIFTNTVGRPLYSNVNGQITPTVLGSYGLFVNEDGMLESLANEDAPTRKVNEVLLPGGYVNTWCLNNGATRTLEMLYRSAYTVEVLFGHASQVLGGTAQLVPNDEGGVDSWVGMSMAPSIWLVNFALLYILNPRVAAEMPAAWAPIPSDVANAILASPTGQVPYSDYASYLQ